MVLKIRTAAVLTAMALAVAACGGDDDGDDATATTGSGGSETTAPAAGEVDRDAVLRFSTNAFGTNFDPHQSRNFATDVPWSHAIYDRLILLAGTELKPMLAESWELSDDRMTLTVNLRDGVTFHDGEPFNAEAVAANIERGKTLETSTVASVFGIIDEVEVADELTAVFHLNADGALLPYTLADVPGSMVSPAAFDSDLSQQPIGAGPYRLVSSTSDAATYERFEGYWDPDRAAFARIEARVIADDTARMNAFQTGQLDLMQMSATQYAQAEQLEAAGKATIHEVAGTLLYGVGLNVDVPELADPLVRRALNLAIDRDAINEGLLEGQCPATLQPFSPSSIGHDPALDDSIAYDPQEAKRLLEEAGVSGLTLRTNVIGVAPFTDVSAAVQAQLADVGVTLDLNNLPGTESRAEWRTGEWDAFGGSLAAGPDPMITLNQTYLGTDGVGGPGSDALVKLVEDAAALEIGSSEREEAMQAISAELTETPRHIMVCAPSLHWLATPGVIVDSGAFYAYQRIFDPTFLAIAAG